MIIMPVVNPDEIKITSALASDIWQEYYTSLIGVDQVNYILAAFQSPDAISAQINSEGYLYYLAYDETARRAAAYCGVRSDGDVLFLSKIYVHSDYRRAGLFSSMLNRALEDAPETSKVWLTVNKGNALAISAYKAKGFTVESELVTDIGSGYVMDDYKMVLEI